VRELKISGFKMHLGQLEAGPLKQSHARLGGHGLHFRRTLAPPTARDGGGFASPGGRGGDGAGGAAVRRAVERICAHATPDGEDQPENPERLRGIWRKLNDEGVVSRYGPIALVAALLPGSRIALFWYLLLGRNWRELCDGFGVRSSVESPERSSRASAALHLRRSSD
jgi:hypothetical protein